MPDDAETKTPSASAHGPVVGGPGEKYQHNHPKSSVLSTNWIEPDSESHQFYDPQALGLNHFHPTNNNDSAPQGSTTIGAHHHIGSGPARQGNK